MANLSDGTMKAWFVAADAARLLLVIRHFALAPTDEDRRLSRWPSEPVSRVLSREYHLQKLDFLLRNPTYLAYELIELHRLGEIDALDADEIKKSVRAILAQGEQEQHTLLFLKFWRGAYENIDEVKEFWYAYNLVYTEIEPRSLPGGEATPVTYFFLTPEGEAVAERLVAEVEVARWYDTRTRLIHAYFKNISPARLKSLQYSHREYREAQLNEMIPELTRSQVNSIFQLVFNEDLEIIDGQSTAA